MKTIPKFEVQQATFDRTEVSVYNNYTMNHAKQNVRSLQPIIKRFRVFLNSKETITFSNFPLSRMDELKSLLPKHRLSVNY